MTSTVLPSTGIRIGSNASSTGRNSLPAESAEAAKVELRLIGGLPQLDGLGPRLRRVAQATVGTALALDNELDRLGPLARNRVGNADIKMLAINLLLAEELVFVRQAFGQPGLAQDNSVCVALEAELVAIQVVAVFDRPVDLYGVARVGNDVAIGVFGAQWLLVLGSAGELRLTSGAGETGRRVGVIGRFVSRQKHLRSGAA